MNSNIGIMRPRVLGGVCASCTLIFVGNERSMDTIPLSEAFNGELGSVYKRRLPDPPK